MDWAQSLLNEISTFYIVLGVIALYLSFGFRVAKEHERFAVFLLGRFDKLKGPGLVFKVPGQSQEWVRIAVGDRGELIGDDVAKFRDKVLPVKVDGAVPLGATVQVRSFGILDIVVYPDTSRSKTITCEKCGHEMRI